MFETLGKLAKRAELFTNKGLRVNSCSGFWVMQLSFVKISIEIWATRRDSDLEAYVICENTERYWRQVCFEPSFSDLTHAHMPLLLLVTHSVRMIFRITEGTFKTILFHPPTMGRDTRPGCSKVFPETSLVLVSLLQPGSLSITSQHVGNLFWTSF